MKYYEGNIIKLLPKQIFVFGSNFEGRHGKGAALFAKQSCGAIYGQAMGRQGNSYAIVTKDLKKNIHPSVSKSFIIEQIGGLYEYARLNKNNEFLIAYNANGNNLNAYSSMDMAEMFASHPIPDNIIFEKKFLQIISNLKNWIDIENNYIYFDITLNSLSIL